MLSTYRSRRKTQSEADFGRNSQLGRFFPPRHFSTYAGPVRHGESALMHTVIVRNIIIVHNVTILPSFVQMENPFQLH